jgi:quercetin dioxygenase-like cupin family protein
MPITHVRSADVPMQDFGAVRLHALAHPAAQHTDSIVLRATVAVGAEFPTHSHDRDEILVFLAGSARFTVGQETGTVAAGDLLVVPSGLNHTFAPIEDIDAIAILPAGTATFDPAGNLVEQRV